MFPPTPQGVKVRDGKYFFEKSASQENLACLSNQALPSNFYTQIFVKNIKYQISNIKKRVSGKSCLPQQPGSAFQLLHTGICENYHILSNEDTISHPCIAMDELILLNPDLWLFLIDNGTPIIKSILSKPKSCFMDGEMGDKLNSLPLMSFNLLEPSPIKKLRNNSYI